MIDSDYLIVGAGISALTAAKHLTDRGCSCLVLEKSRGVGGRMATRRVARSVFDHGAQFFTARSQPFMEMVSWWRQEGSAHEWCRGFPDQNGRTSDVGHPRFCGVGGMTSIPKLLSRQLNVRLNTKIIHIQVASRRWVLTAESGERFSGSHLLLTAPVPQSLALLEGCEFYIPAGSQEALQSIRYDLCIAALITLADRSDIPSPGGISFKEGPITWIADNYQKGISPMEHAITIHTSPEFSRDFWHASDDLALGEILNSVRRWIPSEINHATLHRWRYSKPAYTPFETVLHLSGPPSLTFAGDAFGASRVEGAALSGLAAAKCLLEC